MIALFDRSCLGFNGSNAGSSEYGSGQEVLDVDDYSIDKRTSKKVTLNITTPTTPNH